MKYRVHTFQANRYVYEVEADSAEEAYRKVDNEGCDMQPVVVDTDDPEWLPHMLVDPILETGEVDYENGGWYPKAQEGLADEEVQAVRNLRERGYAVVIFSPEEVESAASGKVEDRLIELGWDVIDALKTTA